MEFQRTTLPNGLTVIGEVSPANASLAVGFFARTGSRDETADINGVSHFLEHMMFKGTDRRTAFDVNREFDDMGANYNAFTSEENTVYYAAVLPEFQANAVDLLGDMLRPALRSDDFETEKKVILEEIALYEDRPHFKVYESLLTEYFAGHPLGQPVLGSPASIRALTAEQMREYFTRRYSPNNVTVVAAGRVDWPGFVQQVTAACGHWTPADAPRTAGDFAGQPRLRVLTDPKLTRQNMALMSPAPAAQSPDRYPAKLASSILGDATGSRLYYALVEPAIAEEASVSYDAMDGTGGMMIFIVTDPERAAEALAIARAELARFKAEGPTANEVMAAKNKIASGSVLSGELPMGRLTAIGFDWVYRRTYQPLAEQIDELMAVRADQVQAVTQKYDIENLTMVTLGPLADLKSQI